jgi:hypothetical protein
MRFVEIENGRARYVLPAELAGEYAVLPPSAVEIALDAEVAEGDVYVIDAEGNGTFRKPTPEEIAAPSRARFDVARDALFEETRWVRERHADRVELGIDDQANWTSWLNYWQTLRDLPDTEGFDPERVVWPEKPE